MDQIAIACPEGSFGYFGINLSPPDTIPLAEPTPDRGPAADPLSWNYIASWVNEVNRNLHPNLKESDGIIAKQRSKRNTKSNMYFSDAQIQWLTEYHETYHPVADNNGDWLLTAFRFNIQFGGDRSKQDIRLKMQSVVGANAA